MTRGWLAMLALCAACKDKTPPKDPPATPPVVVTGDRPAWTVVLDGVEEVIDAFAAGGGMVVEADATLFAVRDGKVAWKTPLPVGDDVIGVAGPCVLTSGEALRCVELATGAIAWSLPNVPDAPPWVAAAPRGGGALLIGLGGARATITLAGCAAAPACIAPLPPLPRAAGTGDVPDDDDGGLTRSLVSLGDDRWAWITDLELHLLDGDKPIAAFTLPTGPGLVTDGVATEARALVVGWGAHVYRLELAACASGTPVETPIAIDQAPPGCVQAIADRAEDTADGYAPAVLPDGAVVFTSDGVVHLWRGGKAAWSQDAGAATHVVVDGDRVLVGAAGEADIPPEIVALSIATGAITERTALKDLPSVGLLDVPLLAADDKHVYVVIENVVAALRR